MAKTILWSVRPAIWDKLAESANMLDNQFISPEEYIERLRSFGLSADAAPGDNIVIRLERTPMFDQAKTGAN